MKVKDKVRVYSPANFYSGDGEIIGETNNCFRVRISNHKTFDKLWDDQKEEIKLFNKKTKLERGFSKEINTGCFCIIEEIL